MKKKKILIVEDDAFLLSMYKTKFDIEKFDVVLSDDGEKGLKMAAKAKPDLIVLDIILPKMDGFEVLKNIKNDESLKDIPVVLLTNLSQKSEIERGLGLKAVDYLIKAHYTPSEVVEKVKEILKEKK